MKIKKCLYLLLVVLFVLTFSQVTLGAEQVNQTEINISHQIERQFKPEIAKVNVEVWALKKDLKDAYSEATVNMNEVIKEIKGFDDLTYTTSSFSVGQKYVEENKKQALYYEVSTMIKIETDNLEQLGDIIQTVISKGATNIRGISYGLKYPEKAKNKVIKDGIKEIYEKAEVILTSLKMESYQIVRLDINEGYSLYNYNYNVARSQDLGSKEALPVPEISPQDVNINVNFNVKLLYK